MIVTVDIVEAWPNSGRCTTGIKEDYRSSNRQKYIPSTRKSKNLLEGTSQGDPGRPFCKAGCGQGSGSASEESNMKGSGLYVAEAKVLTATVLGMNSVICFVRNALR
jgi:hypothetical protein